MTQSRLDRPVVAGGRVLAAVCVVERCCRSSGTILFGQFYKRPVAVLISDDTGIGALDLADGPLSLRDARHRYPAAVREFQSLIAEHGPCAPAHVLPGDTMGADTAAKGRPSDPAPPDPRPDPAR